MKEEYDDACYKLFQETIKPYGQKEYIEEKMGKELSINARLALAFDDFFINSDGDFVSNQDCRRDLPLYDEDNLAAFALLEKAKRDGKVLYYEISSGSMSASCLAESNVTISEVEVAAKLSKAITQALAKLLPEDK